MTILFQCYPLESLSPSGTFIPVKSGEVGKAERQPIFTERHEIGGIIAPNLGITEFAASLGIFGFVSSRNSLSYGNLVMNRYYRCMH